MSIEVVVILKLDAARKNDDAEHLRFQWSASHRDVHHGALRGAAAQSLDEKQLLARGEAAVLAQSVLPHFHRLATSHEEPTPRTLHVQPAKSQGLPAAAGRRGGRLQTRSTGHKIARGGALAKTLEVGERFLLRLPQQHSKMSKRAFSSTHAAHTDSAGCLLVFLDVVTLPTRSNSVKQQTRSARTRAHTRSAGRLLPVIDVFAPHDIQIGHRPNMLHLTATADHFPQRDESERRTGCLPSKTRSLFSRSAAWHSHSSPTIFPRNSGTMVFATVLKPATSGTMVFAMVLEPANSGTVVFAMVFGTSEFGDGEFGDHGICDGFETSEFGDDGICDGFGTSELGDHGICDGFGTSEFGDHGVCDAFPATEAPGVRGVLRLCYKSRLSSHGSSGYPRRTTSVLHKSTFQPRKLRVSAAYYVCTTKKSTFQPRKLRASAAYYVCATKVDFPATEAPGVHGVLNLYYKNRLSSHGSSGRPRRTTFALQQSTFQPRKSPAYYVCTTKVEKKTQKHYGFSNATMRTPAEGLRLYVKKRKKHDGFGTATTRKPAEGLRLYVKKRKNTTVLAPRQRQNPQRVDADTEKKPKNNGFSAEGIPSALKPLFFGFNILSAARKKRKQTRVLALRPRRNPQRVVRGHKET